MDNLKEELLQKKLKLHLQDINEKAKGDDLQKDIAVARQNPPHSAKHAA